MEYKELKISITSKNYDKLIEALYFSENLLGIKEDLDFVDFEKIDPYLNEEPINTNNIKTITVYLKNNSDISFIPQIYESLTVDDKTYIPNNNWKKHFKTIYINNIIIKPSWESSKSKPQKIKITIDPGLAFGTGLHNTTQGIIEYLSNKEEKLKNKNIIDIGCGTGLLSIIACKYGANLTAIDMDIDAIIEAKNNFEINNCKNITIKHSNIEDFIHVTTQADKTQKYDIVMANIISSILISNKNYLLKLVSNKGTLVIAGILLTEKEKILKHFYSSFTKYKEIIKEEWLTIIFEK